MAIELQTFASGDTDYIAKLNANVAALMDAINALQFQAGSATGAVSVGTLMDSLFNRADALIGPGSYVPTLTGSTLTISAGGMYLAASQKAVALQNAIGLSFVGQTAGTYYIVVDSNGTPTRAASLQSGGNIYSVYWNGSAFGELIYLVKIFYDTNESDASRRSLGLGPTSPPEEIAYDTLDERLEAGEAIATEALSKADLLLEQARVIYRKVGITVDSTPGVKGAIQIDFGGKIIGWSVIADQAGLLQVEVSRKTSFAPPAAPNVPDPVADKISAAAPIALDSTQSASSGAAGVSTWNVNLTKWDVIQFKVAIGMTFSRATLYILIEEFVPVVTPLSPPEEDELVESPPV